MSAFFALSIWILVIYINSSGRTLKKRTRENLKGMLTWLCPELANNYVLA